MKIVVIGGTGLIGSKLVKLFHGHAHEVVPASPDTGVNSITGEGLTDALAGADVVVDVSNAPAWEPKAVLEFFETSTRNILDAEAAAGVGHHVVLSVVGTERMESGYMIAKLAQENLVTSSAIPYSIVRATQFFEFATRIASDASDGDTVRVPPVLIQSMAADDVAAAVCNVTLGAPLNGTSEIGGPEPMRYEDFVRQGLRAIGDQRAWSPIPKLGTSAPAWRSAPCFPVTEPTSARRASATGSASRPRRGRRAHQSRGALPCR